LQAINWQLSDKSLLRKLVGDSNKVNSLVSRQLLDWFIRIGLTGESRRTKQGRDNIDMKINLH
jgi:hypothetical protein